jgi:hypothetical protein
MDEATTRTERLKYLIELLRLAWVTLIAAGSGTVGTLFSDRTPIAIALIGAGLALIIVLIGATLAIDASIRKLLADMEGR